MTFSERSKALYSAYLSITNLIAKQITSRKIRFHSVYCARLHDTFNRIPKTNQPFLERKIQRTRPSPEAQSRNLTIFLAR